MMVLSSRCSYDRMVIDGGYLVVDAEAAGVGVTVGHEHRQNRESAEYLRKHVNARPVQQDCLRAAHRSNGNT